MPARKTAAKSTKARTSTTANKSALQNLQGQIDAIYRSQAVIEFDLDGNILTANDNFLNALGYSLDEIQGKHHRIFCDPKFVSTPEYADFWAKLNRGEFDSGEYKRFRKDGSEVWIQASYNPVLDNKGTPVKVVKFASDVTEQKLQTLNYQGRVDAMDRSQAVIEFNLDGTIITANENFLNAVGYSLAEIQGQHHRIFCDPEYANSLEYDSFWKKLNRGEFDSGEYMRVGKGGKEIWIQASYNPIFDANRNPVRVVKFASDITEQVKSRQEAYRLRRVVDNSEAAYMMIDRDFYITYFNDATRELLTKHLATLRAQWPNLDIDKLMGANIDQFHVNPKHQRELLADPSNLPIKTDIEVGPLTIALTVTAQLDIDGEYVGTNLEWKDVTDERKREIVDRKNSEFQAREVSELSAILQGIASGDLSQDYEVAPGDEDTHETRSVFSNIANAVNSMSDNLRGLIRSLSSNASQLASTSQQLSSTANDLASGAEETTGQSATVAAAAEEMSTNMTNMAASTEEMTTNVQSVAKAVDELTASISEIAKTSEQASHIAQNATQLTESSNQTIGQLGEAAEEIGKVIEVIQDIAEQTNLLALNATIEAARAGEAGKGFAVVATEVKELARQTADATQDIRVRIEGIQSSTKEAVRSIADVGEAIQQVNSTSSTIASAVEEQSITTKEIAANVNQTASATTMVSTGVAESASACTEISRNIVGVDQAAKQTAQGASETQTVGSQLSELSEELQRIVGQFKVDTSTLANAATAAEQKYGEPVLAG
ncbi:PAS domain S-box protein [Aeoliella sp. ICT_H6.2]|uniref:PAS domain S-box protein n=1 Tax=Aeoliella straminimaris TaxID=2954799 RepID=A0A9X2F7J3_9BACT|nr:PAS domain S-box protein [Aeoliella straminimaris]MCO6043802.1 PAS domain S-box protein [Aeoliella straminimaris]